MHIYEDIANRTDGDIYIGVVGPVRTGKSTFIKKFMDLLVLPNIEGDHRRERAQDELPQSAAGRTIMTTEPKFIPNEAVEIRLDGGATMKVRMIDCVGYLVGGALGSTEDGEMRMVKTPWFSEEIPFDRAAEIGTQKVIREHSTIGLVITTDGTITEIERDNYLPAEERVIAELTEMGKPFIVILNSTEPHSAACQTLKDEMEEKYGVPVLPLNCATLDREDISGIIERVLFEFPLAEIAIDLPGWVDALDEDDEIKTSLLAAIADSMEGVTRVRHMDKMLTAVTACPYAEEARMQEINLGNGHVRFAVTAPKGLFYEVLSRATGLSIDGEEMLMNVIRELATAKRKYDKLEYALHEVEETGYGIVTPDVDDLRLEEPEIVRHGGRFGIRLRASAPSIHMMRADVETEVSPIVGTEKQSEELVQYLLSEFEVDPKKIWESNLFGKSLHALVNEGLHNKLYRMPEAAQGKLRETLERIINEGSGGLICIIL
ncbi:MAG: stage IV sporulation protein A [Clostridia bacterium]|nr:stage IV sporulation protein A [Oscillospiraceae bacterium]MBQ7033945.1 stage IV sporulation protein A [Clostridia bacterium]